MKRVVSIILIIIFLLLGILIALPIFFKDKMLVYAKKMLNEQLNAKVELADLNLSLIRSFPKLSLNMQEVMIKGVGHFENDTLLYVPVVQTSAPIGSLFNPSKMSISEFVVDKAKINLLVNEEGEVNWNLVVADSADTKTETAPKETKSADNSDFKLKLDKILFKNADLKYTDKKTNMSLALTDITFNIGGEMYGSSTSLDAKANVQDIAFDYGGINYISKTLLNIKTQLDADFNSMTFKIGENELLVNQLPLQLNGTVKMTSDTVFCDLSLEAKASDFEDFLALVPPAYESYLKDIDASGTASIKGTVKGFYFEDDYPAIRLNANVDKARFKYAGMPEELQNISAKIAITKPQGILDKMQIDVSRAHVEIRETPVDFRLKVNQPVSDPYFEGNLTGKVNLAQLKQALPLDRVNMSGVIEANIAASGTYSAIEKEAYDRIKSDGEVRLNNFEYSSPDFTQKILVPEGKLDLSPREINLSRLMMQIGQSDFQLSGKVRNYLNYLLKEGTLVADLQLNSKKVAINELMNLQADDETLEKEDESAAKTSETAAGSVAFDIPDRVNITFRSDIASAAYNGIPIKNINGLIKTAKQKLTLQNLSMDMLKGKMLMNGAYQNTKENKPLFDFGFNIRNFDIPTMFQTLSGFRDKVPIAGNSTGLLNSKLKIDGQLDEKLKPISKTINGKGDFSTKNLVLLNSSVFEQLNGIINQDKLKNIKVDDFDASGTVENGNLKIKPFTTKVMGQEATFNGSLSVDNIIDMRIDFDIERDAFGPDIQKILSAIPGNEKIKTLPAGVKISGSADKPKVSPDLSKTTKAVANAAKDNLKESIGKGLLELFK